MGEVEFFPVLEGFVEVGGVVLWIREVIIIGWCIVYSVMGWGRIV